MAPIVRQRLLALVTWHCSHCCLVGVEVEVAVVERGGRCVLTRWLVVEVVIHRHGSPG